MASSDVVLSAALRNNLLSLQNTQKNIDTVQLRLATGLKVNSALDNPQSFFTAQSLNNRASDLTRLLDGIKLSIQTITEADKGVTALSDLLNQAQSITNSARDELANSSTTARALGNVDLSATANITTLASVTAGNQVRIYTTDDSGTQIHQDATIVNGDTAYSLAAKITNLFADNQSGEVTANVTDDGFLSIQSKDGRTFKITTVAGGATTLALAGFASLGLDRYLEDQTRGATTIAAGTIVAGNTAQSISLYQSAGVLAKAGDLVVSTSANGYLDSNGNTALSQLTAADSITVTVNNSGVITTGAIALAATTTFQNVVDSVNQTAAINKYVQASFDDKTGSISFTSLQDSVENVQLIFTTANAETVNLGFGDPSAHLDPLTTAAGANDIVLSFNNSTSALDSLASDYNSIRTQIDALVKDANFRGVNLLGGDDLTTFFNEDNSSFLTTSGADLSSNGLGLTQASFRSQTTVDLSASQTRDALVTVRNFGSSLATSLSIVQTREDFTQNTVNTLKAGAEDLTVADQNEEGANLLALQTRQQLGVTSLSLAAQSQQSVLRLF